MATIFGIQIAGRTFFRITKADKSGRYNWHTLDAFTRTVKGKERTERWSGPTFETAQECAEHALGFAAGQLGVEIEPSKVARVELADAQRSPHFMPRKRDPKLAKLAGVLCSEAAEEGAKDSERDAKPKAKKGGKKAKAEQDDDLNPAGGTGLGSHE